MTAIRIVLVDDHAVIRDGLRMVLGAQEDMEVVGEAGNGHEAVRLVQEQKPDVVVMDITMPELNGIDAALRMQELGLEVRIIILSMHATSEHIYRAFRAGAQGYLLKESAGKEVVDAVRHVMEGHRHLSQKISDTMVEDYIHFREGGGDHSPLDLLSPREREVMQLVVEGKSSAVIAAQVNLSPKTVETYRSRLMHKLQVRDLPSLVKLALEHGLISGD